MFGLDSVFYLLAWGLFYQVLYFGVCFVVMAVRFYEESGLFYRKLIALVCMGGFDKGMDFCVFWER